MSRELFRTTFINRDSRLLKVYITCQYCIASLFLGMFLVLTGIMMMSYADDSLTDALTADQIKAKANNSQLFGQIVMISGCVLLVMAVILFFFSSLLFMRTTTTPPADNWRDFVEEQPQSQSTQEEVILSESTTDVNDFDGIEEDVDNRFEGDSDNQTRDKSKRTAV